MTDIKKIAVAVDFSSTSINALKMAIELAKKFDAQLDAIHCAPIAAVALPIDGQLINNEEVFQKGIAEAKEQLATLVRKNSKNFDNINQQVVWGEPTTEVNKYVAANDIDLIVIGKHGCTGLKHLFMGSVAGSVLRHAHVPVMCIHSS